MAQQRHSETPTRLHALEQHENLAETSPKRSNQIIHWVDLSFPSIWPHICRTFNRKIQIDFLTISTFALDLKHGSSEFSILIHAQHQALAYATVQLLIRL
jgi:hypothetical protein